MAYASALLPRWTVAPIRPPLIECCWSYPPIATAHSTRRGSWARLIVLAAFCARSATACSGRGLEGRRQRLSIVGRNSRHATLPNSGVR
jgi:hypothetical protein